MPNLTVRIKDDTLSWIYQDDARSLQGLGATEIARVSHVEPHGNAWLADLSPIGGPVLGPFTHRTVALAAEVAWLQQHRGL